MGSGNEEVRLCVAQHCGIKAFERDPDDADAFIVGECLDDSLGEFGAAGSSDINSH
jgi:hypothetical protein